MDAGIHSGAVSRDEKDHVQSFLHSSKIRVYPGCSY